MIEQKEREAVKIAELQVILAEASGGPPIAGDNPMQADPSPVPDP